MNGARSELSVLYEDEDLVVVDKPSGMLVVPAPGRSGATVVDLAGRQLGHRVYAVHRLDEDTTGVLVLARSPESRAALEQTFRGHLARRVYLAVTARAPHPAAGRIESRLGEDSYGRVRSVTTGGERAVTHYRTLARLPRGGALVECELETGRRNQIRAHLAELGCPIVGDRKYGWRPRRGAQGRDEVAAKRPLLHAETIEFTHPRTGARVCVRASAPESVLHR